MYLKLISAFAVGLLMASCHSRPEPMTLQLADGWKVQSSAKTSTDGSQITDTAGWYNASVPSTAMAVLMENGALPSDLLDGMNYKTVDRTQFLVVANFFRVAETR